MINWIEDVGAPVAVTAVNIAVRTSDAKVGNIPVADIATYGMAVGGYLAAGMNWGGRWNGFLKNIGIAAAPLALDKLYTMVKGGGATRMAGGMRRMSRYPAPAPETPFQNVRLA